VPRLPAAPLTVYFRCMTTPSSMEVVGDALAKSTASELEAPSRRRLAAPRRYKQALVSWGAAYAVITFILAVLGPTIAPWPLALRTLVISAVMVATLTWLVMPSLTRLLRSWLVGP
jgi:antibiotic biosynthesis monooxygenase (ABM) superfamily enzyme